MKRILLLFVALIAAITLWSGNTITYTADTKLKQAFDTYSSGLHTNAFNVSITSHTFSDGVGTITFSGDVTSIGNEAFRGCSGITSVCIPNSVVNIGQSAFNSCSNLNSITVPDSVTSIGNWAFYGCSSLTSITIGNSVKSIGTYTFEGCPSLTSIFIPSSVTSIGNPAFGHCSSLTSIVVESGNTTFDSRNNCNAIIETASNTLIVGCQSTIIPNSVTSIYYAFYYCNTLTSITIPSSVTRIGRSAFEGCSSLTSITIPNSVTSIERGAFWSCTSLISATIPSSVLSIGEGAFSSCHRLTSLTIPNSVTSIETGAFKGCYGIKSIVVEPGNTTYDSRDNCNAIVETASNTLIAGCQNTFIPNSITSIGDKALYDCIHLTSITIPNSVVSIGSNAFWGCYRLKSIIIPSTVTSIKNDAFQYCTDFTSIIVESGNTMYDSRNNCNALIETASNTLILGAQNTVIPNTVTSIGDWAFVNCNKLISIVIPNSVTSIGDHAFSGCLGLASVTCEAIIPPTCNSSYCFYSVNKSIPVYVPASSIAAYRSTKFWREFTNIQAIPRLEIPVTADQWHYIAFPVDVDGADIEYAGNGTWGYYDGARRATGVSGWQNVDPATTPLNANQGYIFYGDQTGTLYVNIDPATLPSGDQSITLTDYPSFHADNENWNFVGNPYYATYNVRNITPAEMNLYVWNGIGYYAKTAGHDSYTLQPLEAFFVQKKNTENSIDFVAASAGATAPARAWAANSNRYIDIAAVAGGYTDYTRVVLNETASVDYVAGYDLAKFFSDEAPIQLFTLDAQSIECGVQELPNGVEEIALGYTVLESGEIMISTTDMEETYYLYDAETGITTDLRQSNYTFTAEVGTTVNRLSLRRAPNAPTDVEHVDSVNKYVNTPTKLIRDGQVLILRGDRLFDLRGQEVK